MLCYSGDEFLCWKQFKVFLVLAVGHGRTVQHLACVLDIGNLFLGKGVAHDILSQRFLASLVIPGDAVPCVHAEPAVVPVHELLDEIISYLALAFQHGENSGPENFFKLLHVAPWKHIKGPVFSEKAVSDYGMKMRVEPGVISKGMNDHHKAWNSVQKAKHSTKEDLKTFPCAMAEVCQKSPVILEIDTEKNRNAEHKLPVGYWIENIVAYILSEFDHLFGMTAWAQKRALLAQLARPQAFQWNA